MKKASYMLVIPWDIRLVGGVNQVVINLYNQIIKNGKYVPVVMINKREFPKAIEQTIDGRLTIFLRLGGLGHKHRRFWTFIILISSLPFSLFQLYKIIIKHNVETINVHYPSLYSLQFAIIKHTTSFCKNIVLSFHGSDIKNAIESKGIEMVLWKLLLRVVDNIVTCSESLKTELVAIEPRCEKNIHVIYNGIDKTSYDSHRDLSFNIDSRLKNKSFILTIGTFHIIKGHNILIKAFNEISKLYPDYYLVIIGRPAEELESIKNLLLSLKLDEKVIIIEGLEHNKIHSYLNKTQIFVLPSRREGFPIVILEAGIHGVPVIASNVGGIPEIIIHNETGKLFPYNDIDTLAKEILLLIENSQERERLGKNLRIHVLKNFTWEIAYKKYMALLE